MEYPLVGSTLCWFWRKACPVREIQYVQDSPNQVIYCPAKSRNAVFIHERGPAAPEQENKISHTCNMLSLVLLQSSFCNVCKPGVHSSVTRRTPAAHAAMHFFPLSTSCKLLLQTMVGKSLGGGGLFVDNLVYWNLLVNSNDPSLLSTWNLYSWAACWSFEAGLDSLCPLA